MKFFKVLKLGIFIIIFLYLVLGPFRVLLQDKWTQPSLSNTYARIGSFYDTEPAPDVVFIGTSYIHFNVNTLVLFHEFGISSFDFSSPSQDWSASKLYVEEALKNTETKVIVLEASGMMSFVNSEVRHRQALDPLPLSLNKIQNILYTLNRNDELNLEVKYDSIISYIFPVLRYHNRWKELSFEDLQIDPPIRNYHQAQHYHGYGPHYALVLPDFSHYYDSIDVSDIVLAENKKVFEEIISMCNRNQVELLLIKTVSPYWRKGYQDIIEDWTTEYGVTYINYNDKLDDIGIDIETDFFDANYHLNDSGATKSAYAIGEYLKANYDLVDHRDDPAYADWDYDWQVYQQDKAAYFLSHETNWASYVDMLQNPNYTIYMAVKDNVGGDAHAELTSLLSNLGLVSDMNGKNHWSYLVIINNDQVILEEISEEALEYSGDINGHHIELISQNYKKGNSASIKLDHKELFINQRGFGIVVYDNFLEDIVDIVTFDLRGGGKAYR